MSCCFFAGILRYATHAIRNAREANEAALKTDITKSSVAMAERTNSGPKTPSLASPSGRRQSSRRGSTTQTPGSVSSSQSVRGLPLWLKKQFADDLEAKAGIQQFGVGKAFSVAEILESSESYENFERRKLENLFASWKKYSAAEYKKKVLDKFDILSFRERRLQSKKQTPTKGEARSRLSFDWSSDSNTSDDEKPAPKKKDLVGKTITTTKPASATKKKGSSQKTRSTASMSTQSDIVVDSDGTIIGKPLSSFSCFILWQLSHRFCLSSSLLAARDHSRARRMPS